MKASRSPIPVAAKRAPAKAPTLDDDGVDPAHCEYCGEELSDPGLGFLQHIEQNPSCRFLWDNFRQNATREAGET